ncbi:MAG: hypothetical protein ACKVY0_16975 [Prosthecobacter sp.]|uniref:hypothetical protein n=1 Tax=Prosthecobacter sp. TaxID=1965333 RepID=UPI0038FDFADE
MISRAFEVPIFGAPNRVPSHDDLCDDIEAMIRASLLAWRVSVTLAYDVSEEGERALTFHLYTFLDQTARELAVPWKFAHEDPRKGSRSEDVSLVSSSRAGIWIEQSFYAGHQRFYAIEAKRLPTPRDPKKDRTREYVCGDWDRAKDAKKPISGGIERFKENKHGEGLPRSAMIAFVQEGTLDEWFIEVNGWINHIAVTPLPVSTSPWNLSDTISQSEDRSNVHAEYVSTHHRAPAHAPIILRHYWVMLTKVLADSPPLQERVGGR